MKINYDFLDGEKTTVEIEVSQEVETFLINSDKHIHANDEKERYHCYSIDKGEEDGIQYAEPSNIDEIFAEPTREERLHKAIAMLNEKDRDLILAVFFEGRTRREIADERGVSERAVGKQVQRILKKIEKSF